MKGKQEKQCDNFLLYDYMHDYFQLVLLCKAKKQSVINFQTSGRH